MQVTTEGSKVVARRFRGLLGVLTITGVAVGAATVGAATVGALAAERFGDVAANHAHAAGIGWVADAQVTLGCGDGSDYCPDDAVTRAQMATFLHRLSGNAAGIAPSVDATTVRGLTPDQLATDTSQIEARLDALEGRVAALEADNAALGATVAGLEGQVAAQAGEISALQALLVGVSRQDDPQGRDTLRFSGMNLQVVNGTGTTDGEPNGSGNLLIGYDTARSTGGDKSGSHHLVVGDDHDYTAFGGIVAGFRNTVSGNWASVTGGSNNTASGLSASVSGGQSNTASGGWSSVSGGGGNRATGAWSSVSGGMDNTAGGTEGASVSGGWANTASGDLASVSGGAANTASGGRASILGGVSNTVGTANGCHPAC